jgi:uncharacterized membrane protein
MQYVVLNFFLVSVGVAAVVYVKKELAVQHTIKQSEQILKVGEKLEKVDLPPSVEKDVRKLQKNAEKTLEQGNSTSTPPENQSSKK